MKIKNNSNLSEKVKIQIIKIQRAMWVKKNKVVIISFITHIKMVLKV